MKEKSIFLPLLTFYVIVVVVASTDVFCGDEEGYVRFASNLAKGYYSPHDDVDLWFGPGYPIVLLPFVLLKLPWLSAKLLNALMLFIAVLYFYYTLCIYINKKVSFYLSYVMGLYPPFLREIHLLHTETLVFLVICGFSFHFCQSYQNRANSWVHLLLSSIYLGYLALTKVFFGYVILANLLLFLALYLWRKKGELRKTFLTYLFAFVFCIPYLLYTYSLTGKVFYWGNSGGMSLYWMSTPYEGELGSWFSPEEVIENPELKEHQEFFAEISDLSRVERDDAFKRQAIYNIAHNPARYLRNWIANVGRLLFSYPFSYGQHALSTYFYMLPNMFIVVLCILGIYPGYFGRKLIAYELYALVLFSLIAFGGTSLLSAYDRQFRPLVVILLLWIFFIYVRVLRIEMHHESTA